MKIKSKLLIGFGALFVVVVFFGTVAIYYIEGLSGYSKTTLKNNYATLTYTADMRLVLNENNLPLSETAAGAFNAALKKQENNITEPGEKDATAALRADFNSMSSSATGATAAQEEKDIRLQLGKIDAMNMKAIVKKSTYIHTTVENATLYLGAIVFITFLILFVFIINFPGFILNPLNRFIDGIQEISNKNYDARLNFNTNDEFAELAAEFNRMAALLNERENDSLSTILSCESQLKIMMEAMPEAVFALNGREEILFANTAAKKILNIDGQQVNGRAAAEVVHNKKLLHKITGLKKEAEQWQDYEVRRSEIVVPNLKPDPLDTLQFASFPAGMVYFLKPAGEASAQH